MSLMTIQRLAYLAAKALRHSGVAEDLPDVRTLRYYTTIGLLDRPTEMRGRTAYYGRRHLLQLVAIKRLQGRGRTLAAIQERLAGIDNSSLEKLAGVPAGFWKELERLGDAPIDEKNGTPPSRREQFWTCVPSETPDVRTAVIVPIAAGATLVLDGPAARGLDPVVLAHAAPLLEALRERLVELGAIPQAESTNRSNDDHDIETFIEGATHDDHNQG